jgi:argininosuccinate synthase
VNGIVKLALYKGNVIIEGRVSSNSLYDFDIASMDKLGEYDQTDAKGFIKLNVLRLKKYQLQNLLQHKSGVKLWCAKQSAN